MNRDVSYALVVAGGIGIIAYAQTRRKASTFAVPSARTAPPTSTAHVAFGGGQAVSLGAVPGAGPFTCFDSLAHSGMQDLVSPGARNSASSRCSGRLARVCDDVLFTGSGFSVRDQLTGGCGDYDHERGVPLFAIEGEVSING